MAGKMTTYSKGVNPCVFGDHCDHGFFGHLSRQLHQGFMLLTHVANMDINVDP
jgi:hypothetical protein